MIGGFRKNKNRGNIRKKITTGSDDDEGENGVSATNTEAPVLKHAASAPVLKATKTKIKKNNSTLSFNDELQKEDEFVIKKSKASLNMNDEVKKEKKKKKKKENISTNFDGDQSQISAGLKEDVIIKTFDDDEDFGNDDAVHRFSVGGKFAGPGNIPDAATIFAMKKKRERARQFSSQPNFIPLDTNKHESKFPSSKSRLVREEMDDSSDDERIEMKGSSNISHPALERRKQVAKALEEVHDESDHDIEEQEDEELQRWEDEQIKKGSQIPTQQPGPYGPRLPLKSQATDIVYNSPLPPPPAFPYTPSLPTGYAPQLYSSLYSMPAVNNQIYDVDMLAKQLAEQLDTKKQLFRMHEMQRDKTKFDLDSSKENITTLETKSADVSDRFSFYQDMNGFVKDLIECLNEKVKKINELERSMHQVLQKKSEKLITRRRNDLQDEIDEIGNKSTTDFGRINHLKNRRTAEREGRRSRRRKTHTDDHYEGMSSDDEMLPSESLRIEAEKGKILKEAESIFEDVISDFSTTGSIVSRFEQWKFGFSDSYKDAYLGLCLPKLFTPFIKLDLLNWNPLEMEGTKDFENMDWYYSLALYGDHGDSMEINDEDLKLLPNIIEKVLIPKITVLITDVWDPLSTKQTKLAAFLFQRLVDDYPTITKDSKQTKVLFLLFLQ